MNKDCIITFKFENSHIHPFKIKIEKETGYSFIIGQNNS